MFESSKIENVKSKHDFDIKEADVLGSGGFGTVYKAIFNDKTYALKEVNKKGYLEALDIKD